MEDTIRGRDDDKSLDRTSKCLEGKYKWKAINRDHQQLMRGRAVARLSRLDHSPYSAHITLSETLDAETEGRTIGFGQRMSDVTNLTTTFKGPIFLITPVEIQVAPMHAEYAWKERSQDWRSHSEGHIPEEEVTTSGVDHRNPGQSTQMVQSAPCIASTQTGNFYPP